MRNLKVALLLSVVVPVGLLEAFKVTGVLREPTTPITVSQTTTLETVGWEVERPDGDLNIQERIESMLEDEDVCVSQGILIGSYDPESGRYGGSDSLLLTVNVTATVQKGYVESVYLAFFEHYENARIDFFEAHQLLRFENLSIVDLKDWSQQVFINLSGVNRPNGVCLWAPVDWVLRSPNNQTHQMEIAFEVIHFNGTVYKKVVQPCHLKIGPDDNNSFETADEISNGMTYSMLYLGGYDRRDYYKIHVDKGLVIHVYAPDGTSLAEPNFYLDLYDPNGEWKAGSPDCYSPHSVTLTADATGYWFIKAQIDDNHGFYTLKVTVHGAEGGT